MLQSAMRHMHLTKSRHSPPTFTAPLTPCNVPVRRCPVPREQASHRVLIVRVGAHGDILMGTPLLAGLRDAWPDAHLTWAASPHEADAIRANPLIDDLLLWDGAYWKRMLRKMQFPLWLARSLAFRRALHRQRFDVLISLEPEHWPLLARLVGAPLRIGVFDTFREWSGETRTSRHAKLYTHAFTHRDLPIHRTDQFLLPLNALGFPNPDPKAMTMGFTAQDDTTTAEFLRENGVGPSVPFVIIAPVTNWPSRCWPAERYAELADTLHDLGRIVVLIGGPRDADKKATAKITALMRRPPVLAVGGLFSFREMAALIARAEVLLSGDSGPMHVAAAVGTPYVALFGPTSVAARAPLAGRGVTLMRPVPCGPCEQEHCPNQAEDFMRCLHLLSVPEVLEAVSALAQ